MGISGCYWGSIGVLLGWYWGGTGVVLGWYWGGIGVVLGFYWGSIGVCVVISTNLGVAHLAVIVRHAAVICGLVFVEVQHTGDDDAHKDNDKEDNGSKEITVVLKEDICRYKHFLQN